MAEKKASLTVLGGALAGTRFVLEGAGADMLLGSDSSCAFQLSLGGVSPQHARIQVGADGVFTIEDAGSAHGLHVNDSRVDGPVPLRNGDIVWLGTPGEAEVVMLQCILPARPAAAPAPPPAPAAAPEPSLSEDETLALALESENAPARTEIIEAEHAPTGFYTADEVASAAGAPFAADTSTEAAGGSPEADSAPFAAASDADDADATVATPFVASAPEAVSAPFAGPTDNDLVAEDETVAESAPFVVDSAPPPPPPPQFEDDTREQTFEFDGAEQATVVMAGPDVPAPGAVYATDTGFMDEEAATVVVASEPEPTVAMELPPRAPAPPPPPTEYVPVPTAPPPPPPVAKAPPPPAPRPAAPAPAAAKPARPAAPAAAPAPRRPAPRPQPAPRAEAEPAEAPARAAKSSAPVALYAGLGVAAVIALGGGYWAFSRFRSAPPAPAVQAPPTTVAVARATPPPTAPPEVPAEVQPEVQPEPTPLAALPTPAAVATPTPPPPTTLKGAPSPSPTAPAKKGAATPPPVTTPSGPSPEQLRAQQVATLLGQADAALASGQFDQAIGHFDEVLRLDPGHGKATADRAQAVAQRDASRKKFVAGRTIVKTEKAAGGGLAGFEGAEVQRTPDFSGRIEFEMSPASGLKTGDAWTMKFFLVNDGKKAIKIGGVTATTNVNGAGGGGPVAASPKEVAPQQRVQLGQLTGSWRDATTAWSADVLVTANKGDSLKNTLTWR